MDPALKSLDALIAKDPEAQRWSFADHQKGALHEAERIMTLAGKDEEIGIAKKRGPRAITDIRKTPTAVASADSPGTEELCRFIRLLHLINRHCPWAPHPFEVNDAILRELTSNHLNLIVGQQHANKHGPRLRSLIGAGLTPSNIMWITSAEPAPALRSPLPVPTLAPAPLTLEIRPPAGQDHNTLQVYRSPRNRKHCGGKPHLRLLDRARPRTGGRQGIEGRHRLAPHNLVCRTGGIPENPDC